MTHHVPGHYPEPLPEFAQALCRTRPDLPWLGGGTEKNQHQARALCCRCPDLNPCTRWALEHDETAGIWGGLTARQREAMFLARRDSILPGRSTEGEGGSWS